MENLPITTPVLPPTGNANTTSTTGDAASSDAQNGGNFDAALQRELTREPAAASSQAADKVAGDEAGREMSLVDPNLPATSSDTIMAMLLSAPVAAASQPEHIAQATQVAQSVQMLQTSMITAPGIDSVMTPAGARQPQSHEHAGLPEAEADKPRLTAGPEANFAASGKTSSVLAAAGDPALRPTAEIKQLLGTDGAPVIQANALTAMTSHATAYPAASGAAAGQELKIAPQVGTTGWDGALAQKVVWLAGERQQVAELHLNPPHLGPLEVRVSVAADQSGTAHAQFTSPHAAVREAIEAAMPRLREILAESGITLGNTTVGNESFRQQQGFTPADGGLAAWREKADAGASSQAGTIAGVTRSVRNGMVDIFA